MRVYSQGEYVPMENVTWEILCRPSTLVNRNEDVDVEWSDKIRRKSEEALKSVTKNYRREKTHMFKTLLKVVLIVAAAAVLSVGIRQCSNDIICHAAEVSDWKKCETKVMILNTTGQFVTYSVSWMDHDVDKFKGYAILRCGGELQSHKSDIGSKAFRLCIGRHKVKFYGDNGALLNQYIFNLRPGTAEVVITPKEAIPMFFSGLVEPKEAPTLSLIQAAASIVQSSSPSVAAIAESLAREAAIEQAFLDNREAFVRAAKVVTYGNSVILSMSYKQGNILYTMSVRGNAHGFGSIDFTKQITIAKDVIAIYYEGLKDSGYYCYAKQLLKAKNFTQTTLPASSVFRQVVVMLFERGEIC